MQIDGKFPEQSAPPRDRALQEGGGAGEGETTTSHSQVREEGPPGQNNATPRLRHRHNRNPHRFYTSFRICRHIQHDAYIINSSLP
uniref:Uncharacterized protein n=1 Tax=Knipowitschia caucasica TaxID=637954 RepID=A0AAV2LYZ2_KNICA